MPSYVGFLSAITWSLLDSIWQMAIVWTAYYILTNGNKQISAAGKHNLAFMFVTMGSGWFVYSFVHLLNQPVLPIVAGFIPVPVSVKNYIPYLSLVYFVILSIRLIQYCLQSFGQRNIDTGKTVSEMLETFANRYGRLIGISKRRVQVFLSDLTVTAQTSGFFRPIILIPASLVTRLTPKQMEAILVHELFHIRRNDYMINIFMSCFRSIFFFNPFAHLFYKAIALERELACDDGVLEKDYPPALYAEALFCLEKFRQVQPGFFMAADGNKPWLLMERIRRVLGKPPIKKNLFSPLMLFCLAFSFIILGLQPNKPDAVRTVPVLTNSMQAMSVHDDYSVKKINVVLKELSRKRFIQERPAKKQVNHVLQPLPESEPVSEVESVVMNHTFFAEDHELRDFSNQQTAGLNNEEVRGQPGTPFVPSMSLSYESLPVIRTADSLRNIAIQNVIEENISEARLKEIVKLDELSADIDNGNKVLQQAQIKNKQFIRLDQKNIKPLLDKMNRQIRFKKLKIDRLRIELQVAEEEIIHI
jgi:beta-lactamase regulating signal transducer with metallopeptidase domain